MNIPKLNLTEDDSKKNLSKHFIRSVSHGDVLGTSPLRKSSKVTIHTVTNKDRNSDTIISEIDSKNESDRNDCNESRGNDRIKTHRSKSSEKRNIDVPRRRNSLTTESAPGTQKHKHNTLTSSMSRTLSLSKSMMNLNQGSPRPPISPVSSLSPLSPILSPKGSPVISPRSLTPTLSPRNNPKSPRTPRGSLQTSYFDVISYIRRKTSATNSPRPTEITAFCCNTEPICLFYPGRSKWEIGRELLTRPKIWRHLLKTAGFSTDLLDPQMLYDCLNDLEIICNKGSNTANLGSIDCFIPNEISEPIKKKIPSSPDLNLKRALSTEISTNKTSLHLIDSLDSSADEELDKVNTSTVITSLIATTSSDIIVTPPPPPLPLPKKIMKKYKKRVYSFKQCPLSEIKESQKETHYVVLIKNGEIQQVLDCDSPDLLVQNFKENYIRYIPIYQWFQQHNYQDFIPQGKTLQELILSMGTHKLYGYIENTEDPINPRLHVKLKRCSVY